jgi:hypothetical protein
MSQYRHHRDSAPETGRHLLGPATAEKKLGAGGRAERGRHAFMSGSSGLVALPMLRRQEHKAGGVGPVRPRSDDAGGPLEGRQNLVEAAEYVAENDVLLPEVVF